MLIKFGREMIEIGDVTMTTTIQELKERIELFTGCCDIKLIMKGKTLNGDPLQTLGTIPGGLLAKISAIGSKREDIDMAQQTLSQSDPLARRIVNDLDGTPQQHSQGRSQERPRDQKRSPYCFGRIDTLPGLPREETARNILEELSVDVGVLAVMEKYKFKVGALCELYPEG